MSNHLVQYRYHNHTTASCSTRRNDDTVTPTTTSTGNSTGRDKLSARDFYSEFRGHRVEHLEVLVHHLRNHHYPDNDGNDDNVRVQRPVSVSNHNHNNNDAALLRSIETPPTTTISEAAASTRTPYFNNSTQKTNSIIWTAGDSSLDNKYWFRDTVPAVSTYQSILHPPISKPDVTYWLNQTILSHSQQQQDLRYIAVNGAVEASTLNIRTLHLLPQDEFIRDHLQENDILIVSIGGNDVALLPQPCTIVSMLCVMLVCPTICTERGCIYGTIPMDDYCCGCGPSLCSCLCACPPCLGYFRHLFGYRMQQYIERLTSQTKPAKVVVCMIYYPDESNHVETWANRTLQILGYNTNPNRLQTFIRKIYSDVITTIQIKDTETIHVPLYRILDGQTTNDYVARVEPSVTGGKKIAEYLYATLFPSSSSSPYRQSSSTNTPPPPPSPLSFLSHNHLHQQYCSTTDVASAIMTTHTTATPSSLLIYDRS